MGIIIGIALFVIVAVFLGQMLVDMGPEKPHGREVDMVLRDDDKVVMQVRGFGEDDATMEMFYKMEDRVSYAQTLKTADKWIKNMEYVYEQNKQYLTKEHDEYCRRSIEICKEERQELAEEIAERKAREREQRKRQAEREEVCQAQLEKAQQARAKQESVNLQK